MTTITSTVTSSPTLEPVTSDTDKRIYLQISATQLDTFAGSRESCTRKWYLGSVLKLPTLQNKSANFGSRLHEVLERWFKADDHGTPPELYPAGWNEGLTLQEEDLVRRLVSLGLEAGLLAREPDREIESKFFFNLIDEPHLKVDVVGYRDLISRSKWLVSDHKSTGSGDYAKTPYTLPRTTQMPLYGISMVVEAMARGEAVPDEVFVEHNIFCTAQGKAEKREGRQPRVWKVGPVPIPVKGRRKPSFVWFDTDKPLCSECADALGEMAKVTGPVQQVVTDKKTLCSQCGAQALVEDDSTPSLEEQLEVFLARARAMADVKQIKGWQNVRGALNVQAACNAFGGCPYARMCEGRESEEQYRKRIALAQAELDKKNNKPAEAALAIEPPSQQIVSAVPPPAPIPASSTPLTDLKEHRSMTMAMLRRGKPATNGAPAPAPQSAAPVPSTPPPPAAAPPPAGIPGTTNGQPTTFTQNGPTGPAAATSGPEGSMGKAPAPAQGLAALLAQGNTGAVTLTAQPPQVNPNPVPPPPVLTRQNPNQPIMPWAVQGCKACQDGPVSTGVASAGRPCIVCDGIADTDGKPYASRWYDWAFTDGILRATPKAGSNAPAVGAQNAVASTAQPVATAPADLPGNATMLINGQHVAGPAPTVPPPADPAKAGPSSPTSPEGGEAGRDATAQAKPAKRRGRPPKNAQSPAAPATTVTVAEAGVVVEQGFTLCIGCRPLRRELTLFDDLWSDVTSTYAKTQNAKSFYDLKAFERTDRLVAQVATIAEALNGQTVYVPSTRSTEQHALVSALRPLANEVYEA